MYDMYPWDSRADSPRPRLPGPRVGKDGKDGKTGKASKADRNGNDGRASQTTDPATRAVQVALDRRDNGGDAAADAAATHTAVRSGQ